MKQVLCSALVLAGLVPLAGCKEETANAPAPAPATQASTQPAGAAHENDEHPNRIELGTGIVGGLQLTATQDEPITPGGEGAFDLRVTGPRPRAVRFWVGVESGEGSVKAKADEETPGEWHVHVEVPDPLPAGSKFWAEVEPQTGERVKLGFDLKR